MVQALSSISNYVGIPNLDIHSKSHIPFPFFTRQIGNTWERICKKFRCESEDAKYLKEILSGDLQGLDYERLSRIILKSAPFSKEGHYLRKVLSRLAKSELEELFEVYFSLSSIGTWNIKPLLEFLDESNLEKLVDDDKYVGYFKEKIQELADCLPDIEIEPKNTIKREMLKTFTVVANFFPHFMDTILKAFNLLEAGKGPETMWDFSALLEIYWKIFMIPHGVVTLISAGFSAPHEIYMISAAIVLAIVITVCVYIKFRPCPTQLPRARNLTLEADRGKLEPVVGRDHEIQEVAGYLGNRDDNIKTNLMIIGDPGVGKTELIKGVAQKYKEKRIFYLNGPELASGFTPVGDRLRLLFLDVKGHEDKVVFFIDELGEAIRGNPAANFTGFLKPFLSQDGVQVIAATTSEEYNEHIKTDDSLANRFTTIELEATTEEQTRTILHDRIKRKGAEVRFSEGVIDKIIDLTNQEMQPRSAVQLLDVAINSVRSFNLGRFCPKQLEESRLALANARHRYQNVVDRGEEPERDLMPEIHRLRDEISGLEKENEKEIENAKRLRKLIQVQRQFAIVRSRLIKQWTNESKEGAFLQFFILPWIEKTIEELMEKIHEEIPVEVNESLLEHIRD